MKKATIIIFLLSILFSCVEKEKIEPDKQLLTIQAFAYNLELDTSNLAFVLSGDEVNYFESKEIAFDGNSIVFSFDCYVSKGKDIDFKIYGFESTTLLIKAFTDSGKKSFKLVDKGAYNIRIVENGFKNVEIN